MNAPRVRHVRGFAESSCQGHDISDRGGCASFCRGGFFRAVEGVHDQNRVAGFGKAFAHLTECRAESENVGPDEYCCAFAGCWVDEIAVGRSVSSSDGHVGLRYGYRIGYLRKHHGYACSEQRAEVLARD